MFRSGLPWLLLALAPSSFGASGEPAHSAKVPAPHVVAHAAPLLHVDGLLFKDLNKNGKLDPYEDWRLPAQTRALDLLKRMTLEEKAGMMMMANNGGFMGPHGELLEQPTTAATAQAQTLNPDLGVIPGISLSDRPSPRDLILRLNVRWITTKYSGTRPDEAAQWSNAVEEIAEGSRLGIPVALGSDPMQTTHRKPGGGLMGPEVAYSSQWPDQVGFGAIGDPTVVEQFGRIAGAELRAMGATFSVNPIADVATEPRWNRIPGTFGSDAPLDARLVYAYIEGFQGAHVSDTSVLCVAKHFPGDGPVKNGLDPHNPYGKDMVYPAHNLDYHLLPFQAAVRAKSAFIMGSYGIPVGIDTVGSNFSHKVITDLLRDKLGYNGIIVTDWLRAMPWGVENLSQKEREYRLLEAGVDQLGGEHDGSYFVQLVKEGKVPESRLDSSVARILLPLFELGLFENSYVDPPHAKELVGNPQFMAAGLKAQQESIVLLKNADNLLPLKPGTKVYAAHFDPKELARYGSVVSDPASAGVLLIRVNAPYINHTGGGNFFKETHEGTLAYKGSDNADELRAIDALVATGKPVVVVMSMERPAVLSEFLPHVSGILATFGSSDRATADILFGDASPTGKLPFDLPRDMASVLAHKEDAAHDLKDPLFPFGFGLAYH